MKKIRYRQLDAIKGICIVFILVAHYNWSEGERLLFLFPFWINMAVPAFMVISGYVYTKSYLKKEIVNFEGMYKKTILIEKIVRYTFPFFLVYIVEAAARIYMHQLDLNLLEIIFDFLRGGAGHGGYYYPIMLQFIFCFPIIYGIINYNAERGLFICLGINFVYEVIQRAYSMNEECYRLLIFRYFFLISYGCYLALRKKKLQRIYYVIGIAVGILYIVLVQYMGVTPFITIYWSGTSFIACLWFLPVINIIIQNGKFISRPLETLGKASYNIFLMQKLYYGGGAALIYARVGNRVVQFIISLLICLVFGIAFYYIETPLTKYVMKKVKILTCKETE